jgi:hypothetical protein
MDWLTEGLNDLNYWLVLLAGIVSMVIGFIWYYPRVFGEIWRKELQMTKEQTQVNEAMAPMILQSFVLGLIMQSVLFAVLIASGTNTISDAIALAIVLGFAFSFITIADNNLFARRSMILTAIDGGFRIVAMVAGAIVFALWG